MKPAMKRSRSGDTARKLWYVLALIVVLSLLLSSLLLAVQPVR